MKNILLLIQSSMRRNKMAVFSACMCAFSLCLLMVLFGNTEGDKAAEKIRIGYIDNDHTELSDDFKSYLTDTLDMQLIENQSYDELSTMLINKRISVIVEVPVHFEDAAVKGLPENLITTSLNDFENAAFVDVYLNSYMNSMALLGIGAGSDRDVFHELLVESENQQISVQSTAVPKLTNGLNNGLNNGLTDGLTDGLANGLTDGLADDGITFTINSVYADAFVPCMGFYMMFGFFFAISIAFMIYDDRSSGIFERIQSTPVTSLQYIVGSTLFGVINGLLIIGLFFVYLLLTQTEIGVPYGHAILLMVLMMLIQVGFAMMLALLCKSKSAVLTVIFTYGTFGSMIGGAWFPIEFGPDFLQKLAKTTPHYWFMDAFGKMQENADASIVPNIIVLVLFIILVYLVSAIRFTQNKSA